jgi:enterochelin esterase-like enzyme
MNATILFFHRLLTNQFQSATASSRRSVLTVAFCVLLAMMLAAANSSAGPYDDLYTLGPDSLPHDGVPHGTITQPKNIPSKIFPGTSHMYTVYVPAQYDPNKPACLMIFQDGHAYADVNGEYRIPNVFDNLIYRREMPVTIAVFINPGHSTNQPDFSASNWDANSNRPEEYNVLDDRYSQVILQELMPELKQAYNISDNPNDRALSGASSGAIAAFTVAWHHPDQFHKVITTIGSFTAIRGSSARATKNRSAFFSRTASMTTGESADAVDVAGEATLTQQPQSLRRPQAPTQSSIPVATGTARTSGWCKRSPRRVTMLTTRGLLALIPTNTAARSCRKCCAGSGAIIRAPTIRRTAATARRSSRQTQHRPKPALQND